MWELRWGKPWGSCAVAGVATKDAPLNCRGYHRLLGMNEHSWGLDINNLVTRHNDEDMIKFPRTFTEHDYKLPVTFRVILDMDKGTLGYEAEGRYLGTAFQGLQGLCLYPSVSAVYGNTEVSLIYWGEFRGM